MNEYATALVAVAFFGYALVASRLARSVVTGPMVFAGLGLLLGPEGLDLVDFGLDTRGVETILEVTLALLLFADATRIDLRGLVRSSTIPGRLLTIGLVLTVALGTLVAVLLFGELDLWAAALVAAILAPTDAALGEAVVTNQRVPIRVRQSLNIESGLNDGIILPFVTIFLALGESGRDALSGGFVVHTLLEDLGIGVVVGAAVGAAAGVIVALASRRGWLDSTWAPIAAVATPALAFGLADPLGGSGFVATFVAGLAFGALTRDVPKSITDLTDGLAQILAPATFLIFGAAVLGPSLGRLDWSIVAYVALSLTVIRMIPTALALIGTGFRRPTVALMGWFGPRGLASILFVVVIVEESGHVDGVVRLTDIVAWTVAASILLHGITSWPLSNRYATWVERAQRSGEDLAEAESVERRISKRYFERPRPAAPEFEATTHEARE